MRVVTFGLTLLNAIILVCFSMLYACLYNKYNMCNAHTFKSTNGVRIWFTVVLVAPEICPQCMRGMLATHWPKGLHKSTHTQRRSSVRAKRVRPQQRPKHTNIEGDCGTIDIQYVHLPTCMYICSFCARQCVHQVAEIAFFKSLGYRARASAMSYAYATNILLQHIYHYYTTCPIMAIAIAVLVAVAVAFAAAVAAAGLAA